MILSDNLCVRKVQFIRTRVMTTWPLNLAHCALLMWPTENEKKGYNSAPGKKLKKYKGTLFSSIFKVWENKVFFALYILPKGLRYRHFLKSRMAPCWCGQQKIRGWLYLSLRAKIEKSKDNLLSSNFKVRENKVPFVLFF